MAMCSMRRSAFGLIGGLALACQVLVVASAAAQNLGGSPEARKVKNPNPPTKASIAAGAAVFKKHCSHCHGDGGKGDGTSAPSGSKPADLTDAKWARGSTDGELHAVIVNGAGPKFQMKALGGKLKAPKIWDVINYLRSIGPVNAPR